MLLAKPSLARHITLENKRALYLFLITLSTSTSSLLSFVVLARSMSVSDYGLYAYLLSIVGLAGVLASLGLPTLLTREIARASKERNFAELKGLLAFGLVMLSSATIVVGVVIAIAFLDSSSVGAAGISAPLVGIAVLMLYLLQLNALLVAILTGASEPVRAAIPGLIGGVLFLLTLIVMHFTRVAVDALTVLLTQSAVTVLVVGLQLKQILGVFSWNGAQVRARIRWRAWVLEAIPLMGAGVAFTFNSQVDVFLLGTLKGATYTATYQVATKAASVLVLALGSLASVYQPVLSRAHFSGSTHEVQRSSRTISRLGFAVAVAFAATIIPLRTELLGHIFGAAYVAAGQALSILILARLVNASLGAVAPYLAMTEKGRLLFFGLAAESVANLVLNLVLIPAYGTVGAALATGTSMALMNVCMSVYIKRRFGVSMFVV